MHVTREEVDKAVAAAIADGSESALRGAWEAARRLGGAEGWRLGARCLDALGIDVRRFTWSSFMTLDGAEVHVLPDVLAGAWRPHDDDDGSEGWTALVEQSVRAFVAAGFLIELEDGRVDLGPHLPALPELPGCVRCMDEGYCLACEGGGTRLGDSGFGPCSFCKGTGACPRCGPTEDAEEDVAPPVL
jgi:hypothetical protein